MSKILVINQPTGNRGDESAHRAFVRKLSEEYVQDDITVVYFAESKERASQFEVKRENVHYVYLKYIKGTRQIAKMSLMYHIDGVVTVFIPVYHQMEKMIRSADYVVCAPGGICMGRFMNWNHIFWLNRAKKNNCKLAYYSRSFGPFLEGNKERDTFKKISLGLLDYFDFLSIRDRKTMDFADKLSIKYTPSIDSAFLEQPKENIDFLKDKITENYVVFVPNSLIWQPSFKNASPDLIKEFYNGVIESLISFYPNHKIIMMPQLFSQGSNNDYDYFKKLTADSKYIDRITVLPDNLGSDYQQTVIKGSQIVIGARYHSIVFAINNEIPFVSLSYEHKMFGLLSILGLDKRQIDITQIGTESFNNEEAIKKINEIIAQPIVLSTQKKMAKDIADSCFYDFSKNFLKAPKG